MIGSHICNPSRPPPRFGLLLMIIILHHPISMYINICIFILRYTIIPVVVTKFI